LERNGIRGDLSGNAGNNEEARARGEEDSRNKSINSNLLSLPHTMRSIHSLSIVRGIPIMVIYSSAHILDLAQAMNMKKG
jgi:hypothetical protein